jgi:hypothetical protein
VSVETAVVGVGGRRKRRKRKKKRVLDFFSLDALTGGHV